MTSMGALRLGVLASGRGSNLQSLLDAQEKGLIESRVVVVISDKVDAVALDRAHERGIPAQAVQPDRSLPLPQRRTQHEETILNLLRQHKVDLLVLAGYMRILTPLLIKAFPERIINIHPALLPSFPGAHAQRQALEQGVRIAGCTTHFVDELVDHGPTILQAAVVVKPDDTEESLSRRILAAEHQLLPRTVRLLEEGRVGVDGRRVHIDADESWVHSLPALPDTLYGPGY